MTRMDYPLEHERTADDGITMSRRRFLAGANTCFLTFALASTVLDRALAADRDQDRIAGWLERYLQLGRDLGAARTTQLTWQEGMTQLLDECRIEDLLRSIDYAAVLRTFDGAEYNGRSELFHTVQIDGAPAGIYAPEPKQTVITKIAHVKKGGSIPPHGHENMVSCFLHLSGEFRVHLYDKVEDTGNALIVKKTNEYDAQRGDHSSISDQRNNVHWLQAFSGDCFLFSTKLGRVEFGRPYLPRIYVDVEHADVRGDGTLRAPKIPGVRAVELYG